MHTLTSLFQQYWLNILKYIHSHITEMNIPNMWECINILISDDAQLAMLFKLSSVMQLVTQT